MARFLRIEMLYLIQIEFIFFLYIFLEEQSPPHSIIITMLKSFFFHNQIDAA